MGSKRQQTMAKLKREQAVKERRAQKQEKRHAAAAARAAAAAESTPVANVVEDSRVTSGLGETP
jgi:hypothetical protein